ncbi:hypothetical protein OWR28_16865 [Chryseobacterium sp. 1B4]
MKVTFETQIRHTVYFQWFFWTALFLFGTAKSYGEYDGGAFKVLVIYNFCHWMFQIIGANFIYFVLIRHFFDRKKYIEFLMYLLLNLYIISVINRLFLVYIAEPLFTYEVKDSVSSIFTDIPYLLLHYTFPIISGAFILFRSCLSCGIKMKKSKLSNFRKKKWNWNCNRSNPSLIHIFSLIP